MGTTTVRRVYAQVLSTDYRQVTVRRVYAQVLSVVDAPLNIRSVRGQYLQLENSPTNFRTIRGQMLSIEAVKPSFKTNFYTNLLKLINSRNNSKFVEADFTWGAPELAPTSRYNSQILLTARNSSQHSKTVMINYQRFKLAEILIGEPPAWNLSGITKVHQLLDQINTAWNLALTTTDVVNTDVKPSGFTVRVATTSLYFYPGSSVSFGGLPSFEDEYGVQDLDGFTLPDFSTRYPTQDLDGFTRPTFSARYPVQDLPPF
ncbi:hypothetical protein D3C87_1272800 [compost metagenome]